MTATRKIIVLATLVAIVSALAAGAANAEPKNQAPFTRPVGVLVLGQDVRNAAALDVAPTGEAKNELPFTRRIGSQGSGGGATGAVARSGGGSGGIDWPLAGWVLAAGLTFAGGTAVALSSRRLPPHSRA